MDTAIKYRKIFIMTLPRSGSTLLGQILAGHDEIFHLGESLYWKILNPQENPCSCGQLNCQFLRQVHRRVNEKNLSEPLFKIWKMVDKKFWPEKPADKNIFAEKRRSAIREKSFDYWLRRCPASLDVIMKIYKHYSDKEVYVDNTKLHYIGEKLARRKEWGVIILLRDPRGIMLSYRRAGVRKGDFRKAESVLPFCYEFIQSVERLKDDKNVLVVRYEDMCAAPASTFQKITKFIGVPYQEEMIDFNKKKNSARGHVLKGNRFLYEKRDIEIEKADNGWRRDLSAKELKKLYNRKKLIHLYRRFGYFHE